MLKEATTTQTKGETGKSSANLSTIISYLEEILSILKEDYEKIIGAYNFLKERGVPENTKTSSAKTGKEKEKTAPTKKKVVSVEEPEESESPKNSSKPKASSTSKAVASSKSAAKTQDASTTTKKSSSSTASTSTTSKTKK